MVKLVSINPMAVVTRNSTTIRWRSSGSASTCLAATRRRGRGDAAARARRSGVRLSFSLSSTARKAQPDSAAAHSEGAMKSTFAASVPPRKPPITGPKMKPSPNAAPINPMPLARVSGVVTSEM